MVASKWDYSDDPFVGKKKSSAELLKETIELLKECQDVNVLIDIFRHGSEEECKAACETIARLPVTKYTQLLSARDDKDENVRKWVALTIARSGDNFFLPQLAEMLSDESAAVREVVYGAFKEIFTTLLNDRNRAVHEFENGILSDALVKLLKGRSIAGREAAYGFLQEILDEGKLVDFLKVEFDKAKGKSKAKIVHFLKRATHDLNLLICGISDLERKELREKGLVIKTTADNVSRNRKILAN